tara:strand:+ start:703 stop:918 length:216 start_codon:yes stop_codon:yes gene_type:complete
MEMFVGFILYMFVNGEALEFTPKESLSNCLSTKRKILRSQGKGGPQWKCGEGKIKMKEFNGKFHPIQLMEE